MVQFNIDSYLHNLLIFSCAIIFFLVNLYFIWHQAEDAHTNILSGILVSITFPLYSPALAIGYPIVLFGDLNQLLVIATLSSIINVTYFLVTRKKYKIKKEIIEFNCQFHKSSIVIKRVLEEKKLGEIKIIENCGGFDYQDDIESLAKAIDDFYVLLGHFDTIEKL